jgi:anti-anti-sigma factor
MSPGKIHYAIAEHRGFLKLIGEIRYPLAASLNRAVNTLLAAPEIQGVVVDLQETDFMDSTCLGLLARVATLKPPSQSEPPVIVSTHAEINQLLETMGFDQVFVLLKSPGAVAADFVPAAEPAGAPARPDRKVILDAHRALCEMNEKNRQLFQNVIEQLEADEGKS